MTSLQRCAALVLACSMLAACAGGEPPDGGGPDDGGGRGGDHRPLRPLPNVFISPSGEPFRAGPGAPYPVADWFAHADLDHDGRLSRSEVQADAARFFATLDRNHDGIIDGAEVQDYEQTIAPEILPQIENLHAEEGMDTSLTFGDPANPEGRPRGRRADRQPNPAQGVGTQGAAVYALVNTPEPVAAADAQLDGRITRAEFLAAVDARFTSLDKGSRGYLTLATLPKTPIQAEMLKRAARARRERSHRRGPDGGADAPPTESAPPGGG